MTKAEATRPQGALSPDPVPPAAGVLPVFGALVMALLTISFAISLAAVIFAGPLTPLLPVGVLFVLAAAGLGALVAALTSVVRGVLSTPKATLCAVLSEIVLAVAVQVDSDAQRLPTVLAAVGISSLMLAAALFCLGRWRLGQYFRFLPYPVIGGYFAGAGLLLLKGVASILFPTGLADAGPAAPWVWGGTTGLVLAFLWGSHGKRPPWTLPLLVLTAALAIHAVLALRGIPLAEAQSMGLMMPAWPQDALRTTWQQALGAGVDWTAIAAQLPNLAAYTFLGVVAALILLSAIEAATGTDLDLDRELQVAGGSCLVSGILLGPACFHSAADTILGRRLGTVDRRASLVFALACLAAPVFGAPLLGAVPRLVVGALLATLGLDLLLQWGWRIRERLPRGEYAITLLILLAAVGLGFFHAILIGVLTATTLFVLNYGRRSAIRHQLDGSVYRSRVTRGPQAEATLKAAGRSIQIMGLEGYIFFGTGDRLCQSLREHLGQVENARFLVLDFHHVSAVDASAAQSLGRLRRWAAGRQIDLVLAGLRPGLGAFLARQPGLAPAEHGLHRFPDLDHALAWCEDALLTHSSLSDEAAAGIAGILRSWLGDAQAATALQPLLDERTVGAGEHLFELGDPTDCLYFVVEGQVEIQLPSAGPQPLRLQAFGPGAVIGEMGLYRGAARSAAGVATCPTRVCALTCEAMERLETEAPQVASLFHRQVICLLANRLALTNRALRSVMD